MTFSMRNPAAKALFAVALTVALSATISLSTPESAHAAKRVKHITRRTVIDRSRHWVKKRVMYSQSRYYQGYRRDCSGFVSMAWRTGRSYTTRSIHKVSHRISYKHAKPGDAVLMRGHVVVFGGWINKRAKIYWGYEEPTWGKHARKIVRRFGPRGSKMIRRDGIVDRTRVAAKSPTTTSNTTTSVSTATMVSSTSSTSSTPTATTSALTATP